MNSGWRAVHATLLALHPRWFRESSGAEMRLVYEDAVKEYGAMWLVLDAAMSLLRQWVLRRPQEEPAQGFETYFGLMAGRYPGGMPPHLTAGKVTTAFVLSLLLTMLISPV